MLNGLIVTITVEILIQATARNTMVVRNEIFQELDSLVGVVDTSINFYSITG